MLNLKPATNQPNHQQTIQTSKTNPQTTQKPAKPATNHPQTSQL